ncbi:MAG: hypothetical protein ABR607_16355 [Pyrinomonadaceae bacterium]
MSPWVRGILLGMARGWESKSVEDQIDSAKADRDAQIVPRLSQQQREQRELKQSLQLSRAQILSRLKAATSERYRAQLQSSLDHLDARLDEINKGTQR